MFLLVAFLPYDIGYSADEAIGSFFFAMIAPCRKNWLNKYIPLRVFNLMHKLNGFLQ